MAAPPLLSVYLAHSNLQVHICPDANLCAGIQLPVAHSRPAMYNKCVSIQNLQFRPAYSRRGTKTVHSESRYEQIFSSTIVFSIALIILGFIMDTPANILSGLYRIVTMQDLLITDYVYIAGAGAALVNAAL